MKNYQWSKLKACLMLLVAAGVLYSCSKDTVTDDLQEATLQTEQILGTNDAFNAQMRKTQAGSCDTDCIEPGSTTFYPVSDLASLTVGKKTKTVSYNAYNTETDFVVEVTYEITGGPSQAKANITIAIDGDEVEYESVSSGSTVSHTIPLAQDWAGCDQVAFSVVQEGFGTPITFNENYALIPVCEEVTLEIGMEYQGGIIAYILQEGDLGYVANETHGIIAAPSDQSTSISWSKGDGTAGIITGATGTEIGTGQDNTTTIVNIQGPGSYAAQVCNDLVLGGYADWYLPSKDELNKLYENKEAVGGFGQFYWSSSEYDLPAAWLHPFLSTIPQGWDNKNFPLRVRAVRSF